MGRHTHLNLKSINMKLNLKKHLYLFAAVLMFAGTVPFMTSCADDDMSKQ